MSKEQEKPLQFHGGVNHYTKYILHYTKVPNFVAIIDISNCSSIPAICVINWTTKTIPTKIYYTKMRLCKFVMQRPNISHNFCYKEQQQIKNYYILINKIRH